MVNQKEILSQETAIFESDLENLDKQIKANDLAQQLDILEKKMREQEQNLFTLQEFVANAEAEMDYQPMVADVIMLATDLNAKCCEAASSVL